MTKTAAIIGGGVIGGGWLARFVLNGWDVKVFDPDPEAERKIGEVMANARRSLPMLYDRKLPKEGKITFVETLAEAVESVDWVQESVPERLEIKHKVYREIIPHLKETAVLGSSTSGFKPSELQDGIENPSQIVVTHPFNPVYLLPLIELVPSEATSPAIIEAAKDLLESIGMYPLHVRKEIDAHIADRFLEAVWREGLWLIKDGIATTQEIDDAIRYGFGLRWAQMGLFETYRIAGGEAGMEHFIAQFGPCLKWPWTKLMDVPELTDELTKKIADQSNDQSGHLSIRELERKRDNNLVAMMRALKGQNDAAGALIQAHEASLKPEIAPFSSKPIVSVERTIPIDWTDYNGHMNESRYGQVFSDAADEVLRQLGAGPEYLANGFSYFTVNIDINFIEETLDSEEIIVKSIAKLADGKKLRLFHKMERPDGTLLATGDQFLLHVDMNTRKTCLPSGALDSKLNELQSAHATLVENL